MDRKQIFTFTFSLLMALGLSSCLEDTGEVVIHHYSSDEYALISQDLNLPQERLDYTVEFPDHMRRKGLFPSFINNPEATLGRVLFYDKDLSSNKQVSCASCHKQSIGFSDDKALSDGVEGKHTSRNSLALASVVNFPTYYGGNFVGGSFIRPQFLWDEGAATIMDQSRRAFTSDNEMGMEIHEVVDEVNAKDFYRILFRKAFGDETVTEERILAAIQVFVNAFIAADSKFDDGLDMHTDPTVDFSNFTAAENRGKALFMSNCASCHSEDQTLPVMTVANNGLDAQYSDLGVGALTGNSTDNGKFKVPPLRNIALTAPYMHDGRFATLNEVLDHYASGIKNSPNLDQKLKDANGNPIRIEFDAQEREDLLAFFNTLTDETLNNDERFSNPFK